MVVIRAAFLVTILASGVLATEANISGPTEGKPGDLVVISAKASTGKAFKWVMPENIQTLSCSDLEFGFATGTPGTYTFTLIAADTDDSEKPIDVATHVIVIAGTDLIPDPDPDKPVPTPGDYDSLRVVSRDSASALSDTVTAKGLAETIRAQASEIERLCVQNRCPTLDGAKRMMVAAIESRLLMRTGDSRNVNWADGWRVPVNRSLIAASTNTVENYLRAMKAVATGLAES